MGTNGKIPIREHSSQKDLSIPLPADSSVIITEKSVFQGKKSLLILNLHMNSWPHSLFQRTSLCRAVCMAFLGRKVIFRDMKGKNLLCSNPVMKNKEISFFSPPVRHKTVQEIILTEEESKDLNRYVKKHTRVQLGWVGRHSSPSRSFTNNTCHNNQGKATWVFTLQQFIMKIAKCVNIIY